MFNRLYIIGNGFDIAHGYNTRFSNFIEWMQIFYPNDYCTFSTYFDEYLLWNDFEYSLDTFDFDQFSNDHYPIEDTPQGEAKFIGNIDYSLSVFSKISNFLSEWLSNIRYDENTHISKSIVPSSLFLTFNYTSTLELLYVIPQQNILHIHGSFSNKEELICGHNDIKIVRELKKRTDEYHDGYIDQELTNLEYQYFSTTYKDVDKIIKQNNTFFQSLSSVNNINILGHSLNSIDFPYFSRVKTEVSKNCIWNIHCFSNDDMNAANNLIKNLKIINYKIILKDERDYYMN